MMYCRKIVCAIATCVVLASAAQTESNAVQEAKKRIEAATAALSTTGEDAAEKATAELGVKVAEAHLNVVRATEKHDKAPTDEDKATAALDITLKKAVRDHLKAQQELSKVPADADAAKRDVAAKEVEAAKKVEEIAQAEYDLPGFITKAAADKAALKAKLDALEEGKRTPLLEVLEAQLAVSDAIVNKAKAQMAGNDTFTAKAQTTLDAAEKALKAAVAAVAELEKPKLKLSLWESIKNFFCSPGTNWKAARKGVDANGNKLMDSSDPTKQRFNDSNNKATILQALWYVLWPNSKSGYATAGLAAAAVAGGTAAAILSRKRAREAARASSRKKWAVGAGLLAAAGAAAGGKYAYDQYKAKHQPGCESCETEDFSAQADSPATTAGWKDWVYSKPSTSKKDKKAPGFNWKLWGPVAAIALLVIGGAVYFFLFMGGSEDEDDAPADMPDMDIV